MTKATLEAHLSACLMRKNWSKQKICHLPIAFVRDRPVTPYFRPRVLRYSNRAYRIDGEIGLIDQTFETFWMTKEHVVVGRATEVNCNCMVLNIANVRRLLMASAIYADNLEDDAERFCAAIADVLEDMPEDAQALKEAFVDGTLIGIPVQNFSIPTQRRKFDEFREFVLRN